MSDKEYVNEVSDIVLDVIGVGPFVLINSIKKYLRKSRPLELHKIVTRYDLSICLNELVDLSIKDLTNKNIIVNAGCKIQRPHTTRNINHRNN